MNLFFIVLHRYILKRQVGPFFFSLLVITLLFLLNLAFRILGRILSKGLGFAVITEFFMLNLAWIIALTVPMAVLTAVLMSFGALSADNEITAIKASGISLFRIIGFNLMISVVIAIFLIWFNNAILPNLNHRTRMLGADINAKRPTLSLEPGVLFQQDKFNLFIQKIIEEKENVSIVEGVTIFYKENNQYNKTITAQHGEIIIDELRNQLRLKLFDGELHEVDWQNPDSYRLLIFPEHIISIPVPGLKLTRRQDGYYSDREKSAQVMLKEVAEHKKNILKRKSRINEIAVPKISQHLWLQLPQNNKTDFPEKFQFDYKPVNRQSAAQSRQTKSPGISPLQTAIQKLISENRSLLYQLKNENNIIKNYARNSYILLVEVHKKYSIPVACIVFVLVGAPLGIISRRGNMAASAGIGLFFFILYWAFLIAGEELADRQIISPAFAMWSPNVIVGIFGIYLVFIVVKETKFLTIQNLPFQKLWKKMRLAGNDGQVQQND